MLDSHYDTIKHTLDSFTRKNYKLIREAFDDKENKDNKIMKFQYNQLELGMLNNTKKVIENNQLIQLKKSCMIIDE